MVLWKFSYREVLHRPGRALLSLLSIVLGVAAVVSMTIATGTTRVAYERMFATVAGRATLEVTAEGGGSLDAKLLGILEQVPGVRAAVPCLQRPTVLYLPGRRLNVVALGIDPQKDRAVRDYELAAGEFFRRGEGVLLEAEFARGLGLGPNDEIKLLTRRGVWKTRIAGLLRARDAGSFSLGSMVFLPLKTVQRVFAASGRVDVIHLVADESTSRDKLLAEVARRLPAGVHVDRPATRTQLIEQTMLASDLALQMAASFAVLLATFIILNTFLMNVAERRRQLAILRAVGATRRQVAGLLIGESLALGALGTGLGIPAGLGGARLLIVALNRLLLTSLPALHITPWPFVLAVVLGCGISLLGVWLPARKAARLSPLEALGSVTREDLEGTPWALTLAGLAVVVASGAAVAVCVTGRVPVQVGIGASVSLLIGAMLLTPAMLGALVRWTVHWCARWMRSEVRLAFREIPRHHSRSSLTVGVLFVAVSTGLAMASAVIDNMEDVRAWYRQALMGDFFVRAMMPDMATGLSAVLPAELETEIPQVPGIQDLETLRFVRARAGDEPVIVMVRVFAPGTPIYFDLKAGDPDLIRGQLHAGEIVIGTVLAQRTGLRLGDALPLETLEGPRPFRIAGVTNEYIVGGLAVHMERQTARRWLGVEGVDGYIIRAQPRALADVQARLQQLCERHGVLLHSFADISRLIDSMIIGIDGCLWGILALGYVVAALGVFNTLTMNVLEQTREIGLLRVVAMTRGQVRRTILAQAAILGGAGLVPGAVAGVGLSYVINLATMPAIGHPVPFGFHPLLLSASLVGGALLVLAAAWIPAERAARLELMTTLQYE